MPNEPLPTAILMLKLRGQSLYLNRADFPTETLMTLEFVISTERYVMFNWISQSLQGRPQALPGSLVVLDTSFTEVHRDAWDCSLIQQIVFPAMEVASGNVPRFNLALQITNLREVPLEAAAASAASPAVVKFARLPRLR